MTAIKKLERVASEGKFLLSHKNHWDCVSGTAGAMLRPKAALPAMLRPKAALPAMLRPEAAGGSRRA